MQKITPFLWFDKSGGGGREFLHVNLQKFEHRENFPLHGRSSRKEAMLQMKKLDLNALKHAYER